jgi:hypothetical protein
MQIRQTDQNSSFIFCDFGHVLVCLGLISKEHYFDEFEIYRSLSILVGA